jgi:hypothetical protein
MSDHAFENIRELTSFNGSLGRKREFGVDGFIFNGLVTYETQNNTVVEILDVWLIVGGYEPMIRLDINSKRKRITSSEYHLDLIPRFDNITFEPIGNKLMVEVRGSPKLGNYKVTIEEYI